MRAKGKSDPSNTAAVSSMKTQHDGTNRCQHDSVGCGLLLFYVCTLCVLTKLQFTTSQCFMITMQRDCCIAKEYVGMLLTYKTVNCSIF